MLKPEGGLFVYHYPNRYGSIEGIAGLLGRPTHDIGLNRRALETPLSDHGFGVLRSTYRYLLPRNITEFPRRRTSVNRRSDAVYRFDAALTRIPGLRALATTLNEICVRR